MPACRVLLPSLACLLLSVPAAAETLAERLDGEVRKLEPRIVEWRRDIHAHPELSNREARTGALVAAHLKSLGLEVQSGLLKSAHIQRQIDAEQRRRLPDWTRLWRLKVLRLRFKDRLRMMVFAAPRRAPFNDRGSSSPLLCSAKT